MQEKDITNIVKTLIDRNIHDRSTSELEKDYRNVFKMALSIANKYYPGNIDIQQESLFAAYIAITKFNYDIGTSITTYAFAAIQNKLRREYVIEKTKNFVNPIEEPEVYGIATNHDNDTNILLLTLKDILTNDKDFSKDEKALIYYIYYANETIQSICDKNLLQEVGNSTTTIKNFKNKVFRKLKRKMKK